MNSFFLGYDPGGNGKHGICILQLKGESLNCVVCKTVETVKDVLEEIGQYQPFTAAGIDTFTTWSSGESGWRHSDRWLREKYKGVANSVQAANSTYGSMIVSGAIVGRCLLEKGTKTVTETHPKVGYFALTGEEYEREDYFKMVDKLKGTLDLELAYSEDVLHKKGFTDHHFDALFSAVAAYLSVRAEEGGWRKNLHALCEEEGEGERLFYAFGSKDRVVYAWLETECSCEDSFSG